MRYKYKAGNTKFWTTGIKYLGKQPIIAFITNNYPSRNPLQASNSWERVPTTKYSEVQHKHS